MGFTVTCFIRKNTPELRKFAELLGYVCGRPKSPHLPECCYLSLFYGKYWEIVLGIPELFSLDCGKNDKLFQAVGALSTETDFMQWFHVGDRWKLWEHRGFVEDEPDRNEPHFFCRENKATLPELLIHFPVSK